jgi:GTP cyclohydrolase I
MEPLPDRASAAAAIEAFLRAIGRDPDHDASLVGTGARVADAFTDEFCRGYAVDTDALLSANKLAGSTDLVLLRELPVITMCPHHLLPATGSATVAFAPRDHLIGLGTLARLVEAFSCRLTLQEQIGEAVVGAIALHLAPRWVGCRLVFQHACMAARGVRTPTARVETVAFAGTGVDLMLVHQVLGVGR